MPSRGPLPFNKECNQKKDKSIPPPLDSHVTHSNLLTITSTTCTPELREEKKKTGKSNHQRRSGNNTYLFLAQLPTSQPHHPLESITPSEMCTPLFVRRDLGKKLSPHHYYILVCPDSSQWAPFGHKQGKKTHWHWWTLRVHACTRHPLCIISPTLALSPLSANPCYTSAQACTCCPIRMVRPLLWFSIL